MAETSHPTLSIVLLTYREKPEVLRAALQSVADSVGVSLECFVVDNDSAPSDTQSLVHAILPEARYVKNSRNMGFAAAVNVGIRQSRGEYVLLLNPDTRFAPDVLARMLAHLDADPGVGIGSCLIRYPNGTVQDSIRRFPTLRDQLAILFKLPHLFSHLPSIDRYMMRDADPRKTQDVDSIMGAFMFIRRKVIDDVGLLDERYFIWFEEVDYCKMAVDVGWKVRHYADVSIEHHKGHTFSQLAFLRKQRWVRTSLRKYMRKHSGLAAWGLLWLLTPFAITTSYLASLVEKHKRV